MRLELSEDDRRLLRELLHDAYQNLREEIVHTEGVDYKDMLKARENRLADLLRRLESGADDA